MLDAFSQAALDYHRYPDAGKLKVVTTKPMVTRKDLVVLPLLVKPLLKILQSSIIDIAC